MEVRPLYDRLLTFTFNAVPDTHAAIIDGLICGVGNDGAPAAGPILLFHLHDGTGVTPSFEALSAVCMRLGELAASEAARTGDPFAVMRDIAAIDVLHRVCPRIGVERQGHGVDHLLRAPAKRSLGMGRMTLKSLPANASLREVRSNLRRILGIEPAREVRPAACLAS
jgi:hypothetical protein